MIFFNPEFILIPMFKVCETFVSISGESGWQGLVATFIRFTGCDVDCSWCDTEYARREEGTEVSQAELMSICRTVNLSFRKSSPHSARHCWMRVSTCRWKPAAPAWWTNSISG